MNGGGCFFVICDLRLQKHALRSCKYKLCNTIQALSQITFAAKPTCALRATRC